jgi:hypothetical protein
MVMWKEEDIEKMETIGDSPANLKWTWTQTRTRLKGMRHPDECTTDPNLTGTMERPDKQKKEVDKSWAQGKRMGR